MKTSKITSLNKKNKKFIKFCIENTWLYYERKYIMKKNIILSVVFSFSIIAIGIAIAKVITYMIG